MIAAVREYERDGANNMKRAKKHLIPAAAMLALVAALSGIVASQPHIGSAWAVGAPSAWAAEEVREAISNGLVPPDLQSDYASPISRGDFCKTAATFINVKSGMTAGQIIIERGLTFDKSAFSDTQDPDILAASALGIVNGRGNGKFDPQADITRQEAATMLMRLYRYWNLTALQ